MTINLSPAAPVGGRPFSRRSGATAAALAVLAVLLSVAFVVAPRLLAGAGTAERDDLTGVTRAGFLQYWRSGRTDFPPALRQLVDYWARYHLVKAVTAAAFVAVLIALAVVLWRASVRAGTGRGGGLAAGTGGAAILAVLGVPLVLANVQGALAPFSSLMSLLPFGRSGGDLAVMAGQARDQLRSGDRTTWSAPLRVMVDDFGRYHAVVAAAAAPFLVSFLACAVLLWRARARTARSARGSRRLLLLLCGVCAMSVVFLALLCVANVSTAEDPAPAVLLFFQGSY